MGARGVLKMLTKNRRESLVAEASRSRADRKSLAFAVAIVAVYNVVGVADILSTTHAIALGAGEEANPVLRAAMEHFGPAWVAAKLFLQAVISFMVVWFPHRIVLAIFTAAVAFNAAVVWSNLQIGGLI
jgi:hypothetical protein